MYCSDRCRHAAHRQRRRSGRAVTRARRPSDQQLPTAAPTAGGMAAWAAWARATYVIDETGEQLLRLAVEADVRYQQRALCSTLRALTTAEGRLRPEVAVERDTRAAIARLIQQLDLEDMSDEKTTAPAVGDL